DGVEAVGSGFRFVSRSRRDTGVRRPPEAGGARGEVPAVPAHCNVEAARGRVARGCDTGCDIGVGRLARQRVAGMLEARTPRRCPRPARRSTCEEEIMATATLKITGMHCAHCVQA